MSDAALDLETPKTANRLFDKPTSAKVALFPNSDDMRAFHFSAQQLRILESLGLLAGVAEKAFALPLNFKTKREIDDDLRKKLEDLWRALMAKSIMLGVKIAVLRDQIETTIQNLDGLIDKLQDSNKGGKLDGKIDDLKEDRRDLRGRLRELDDIENERMRATPDTIDDVATRVDDYEHSLSSQFRRIRSRTRSNEFIHEADGIDITSAHSGRGMDDDDDTDDPNAKRRNNPDGDEPEP